MVFMTPEVSAKSGISSKAAFGLNRMCYYVLLETGGSNVLRLEDGEGDVGN